MRQGMAVTRFGVQHLVAIRGRPALIRATFYGVCQLMALGPFLHSRFISFVKGGQDQILFLDRHREAA